MLLSTGMAAGTGRGAILSDGMLSAEQKLYLEGFIRGIGTRAASPVGAPAASAPASARAGAARREVMGALRRRDRPEPRPARHFDLADLPGFLRPYLRVPGSV